MSNIAGRKRRHVDVCLREDVEYQRTTTGFEKYRLPYTAIPHTDLEHIDTGTTLLGKRLSAPLIIGAMTGGPAKSKRINQNLSKAAQFLGIGMMLGSQRVMIEHSEARESFAVRKWAPDILLVGNLGLAQLVKGYGAKEARLAVDVVGADALAFHANPLQEALQRNGDTDFKGADQRLEEVIQEVPFPVILKEVGHGLSGRVAQLAAAAGVSAIDVAGAGGTSWARVEQLVSYGDICYPELAEWGIPTTEALKNVRQALPSVPIIASGGVRSGVDVVKALALGAQACAIALPLLAPAVESAEAVIARLKRIIFEMRVAMHCCSAQNISALRQLELVEV